VLLDAILFNVIADWCINLSAGWMGAALIVSAAARRPVRRDQMTFYGNILNAVAYLLLALILKSI